ncbi:SDR family oxidoreductase [Microbispora triticiradicis]|uniref:SDR family oxidoreductase n=1 Tax=Microbispora triticiradicis TaxID=2200763 RepID=UPI001AD75A42|nr:SDR family oxidoreductase [Microbispora triticiradicis]MBO4269935.1 NmrA family NAD(P)-binding protein [Microbispora triticiradicis]
MILVTGATGLSGSIVVREFARQNVPVRALVRDPGKARKLHGLPGVEVVEGDMLRPATLTAALRGVERVLLISSPRERMVETQCVFIDAAKAAGVPHIVKYSGKESGVGFDPDSFTGTREHLEIERHLEASGLAWTHLRPSQFMEFYLPGTSTGVDPHRRELRMSIGDSRLSPIAIEDVAKVAVALMTSAGHEGRAYDMTGPEALTMKEIAEHITEATGTAFRHVELPLDDKAREWTEAGTPEPSVRILRELLAERKRRPESHVRLETHRAFGVRPTSFAEFARRHAAAFLGTVGG